MTDLEKLDKEIARVRAEIKIHAVDEQPIIYGLLDVLNQMRVKRVELVEKGEGCLHTSPES